MDLIHELQPGDPPQPADDWRSMNEPPSGRGHPVIAWACIIAACAFTVSMQRIAANAASTDGGDDPIGVVMMKIQGRHLVTSGQWVKDDREAQDILYKQYQRLLNVGSVGQRQRFVILAAELAGVEEARRVLQELDTELANPPHGDPPELTEAQADVHGLLQALYGPEASADDPDLGSTRLTEDQRELLVERLGWFGQLALAPPESQDEADRKSVLAPAYRVSIVLFSALLAK